MTDPKEKDKQAQQSTDETAEQKSKNTQDANWDEHQQVDEEGNELDPEDIK
ncbi:hypothetical protein [Pedobacter metabolipauper]|uniref:Uncharacterized protein n=1 Tax=Pedobacter metabolipauper TaxID=425513 RepID=A0A4R6T0M4_9SPHI|nr:hypothetical protein [Pedobacter metabolipauper]TDQ11030.1 hypothetical protein ATK78_0144 [Pedobacter metabolipauper]